ncbi:DUF6286 domain-containing protein [Streptomyces sp. DSM 118878]
MREAKGGDGTQSPPAVEEAAADHRSPPTFAGDGTGTGRFWSRRRVPAALLAVLLLAGTGLLLYDIVAVRAGHPAMRWRRELARGLAERPLDDTAVLVGAGVAAALGLWLLVLAATPGERGLLPMRRAHPDVRAGIERGAATMMLRDRAMDVPGVQSVRIRMKRSKVKVRAVSHFRELDDVRDDLDTTMADGIHDLGLTREPGLAVHVARPGRKG